MAKETVSVVDDERNIVKHSPANSEILVATAVNTARHGSPDRTQISVSITDAGPGIPPQEITRIFERFYQVDKSRAKKRGGSGPPRKS